MKITTIASTSLHETFYEGSTPYEPHVPSAETPPVSYADELGEFAGRSCYKSWQRPNPKTATNQGYLDNILDQRHTSVMEHSTVSFWVEGVSRALLVELERHRHISFSVESQRYVSTSESHPEPVIPPAMRGMHLEDALRAKYASDLEAYEYAYDTLRDMGYLKKEAREAARAFLPNATPVDFVVSGNLRAWRDVLGKRHHVSADAEIREFAGAILKELRVIAPASFQDIPHHPYGTVNR